MDHNRVCASFIREMSQTAALDSLLKSKHREWSAMLLKHNPRLQLPLENALTLVYQQRVHLVTAPRQYRVCGNPHDYFVNLETHQCSCRVRMCEHFLAAWFAFSQDELVRAEFEQRTARNLHHDDGERGCWHGMQSHTCADGYCETVVFGYGADTRCARCGEIYSPEYDAALLQ